MTDRETAARKGFWNRMSAADRVAFLARRKRAVAESPYRPGDRGPKINLAKGVSRETS